MSVDPNDYVIVRKRKKYRFALFLNSPLCFELDEWKLHRPDCTGARTTLEVGAGTGLFSVALAKLHPDETFLAIDVKGDRLQKGAREAEMQGLKNIFFIRARADQIDQLMPVHSLGAIWLTFSDPFPKKRSAGRRLTHPTFLKKYAELLQNESGVLLIKHDNQAFFEWSLEQLVSEKWYIRELSFDVHESDLSDEYTIKTTYEERWMDEGRVTKFVAAVPPNGRLSM